MKQLCWQLVDIVSRLLDPNQRDAVRGDLAESGATAGETLLGVLSLVVRQQAGLWLDWRPWLVFAGIIAPFGAWLGGLAKNVARHIATYLWLYGNNWGSGYVTNAWFRTQLIHRIVDISTGCLILFCWSWAIGLAISYLSRRTIWVSGALFFFTLLTAALVPTFPNSFAGNDVVPWLMFYERLFPVVVQVALVFLPTLIGMREGLLVADFPRLLRTIATASALVTIVPVVAMTMWRLHVWGWLGLNVYGTGPMPLLAAVGPLGYLIATMSWRRLRRKAILA